MAESASLATQATETDDFVSRLSGLPVIKQVLLLIGLTASIALGVAIILWMQAPSYGLLFANLSAQDSAGVVSKLDSLGVAYRLENQGTTIMVPAKRVHELRLSLAADGFPSQSETGYHLLDREQGFGISQFRETTQYHRALEGELSSSVASLRQVKKARVHLALPKKSVFVRKQQPPTASVVVELASGGGLSEEEVQAITYLVANSIPNLTPSHVSVVDQSGRLLTESSVNRSLKLNLKQLEFTQQVERDLMQRIVNLISPIAGGDSKVRAQVTADFDFTQQEITQENFNPDPNAVRSELLINEINRGRQNNEGVPGALTNQPPQAGIAPETDYSRNGSGLSGRDVQSGSEKVTRNYEMDRTISHIQSAPGQLVKLSIAVLVDNKMMADESGQMQTVARSDEELEQLRALVANAVGYDANRGDSLSVMNIGFVPEQAIELEGIPIWQQNWFWDIVKQVLGVLGILIIIFGILRPMLREVFGVTPTTETQETLQEVDIEALDPGLPGVTGSAAAVSESVSAMSPETRAAMELAEKTEAVMMDKLNELIEADPKVVANVIRTWLEEG